MYAEKMTALEDRLNGRVIPIWKWWLMFWIISAALVAARDTPDGFWWAFGVAIVTLGAYVLLFTPYRRRTIR